MKRLMSPTAVASLVIPLVAPVMIFPGCFSCPDPADVADARLMLSVAPEGEFNANSTNRIRVEIFNHGPESAKIGPSADGTLSREGISFSVVAANRTYSTPDRSLFHYDTPCGAAWPGCGDRFVLKPGEASSTTVTLSPHLFSGETPSWEPDVAHNVTVSFSGRCNQATWRGVLGANVTIVPSAE